ncbi:MAG: helix-hairpin-helix domain-containing protein [Bacteriovoracaceae bacterium]|nr:helix-hairpin-helix domain-containing protein [Bacteriovoracaceae bacterium]
MKYISMAILLILTFPTHLWAQEDKTDVYVIEDVILRESLRKQDNTAQTPSRFDQRPVAQQRQEQVDPAQVDKLQKQVSELQKEVERLKQQQQRDKSDTHMVEIGRKLMKPKLMGDIGRFRITEGQVSAQTKKGEMESEEKQIPGLQVCTTMADVNRMSQQDFEFLGFDQDSAKDIVAARENLGEFKSSKQLEAIAGVDKSLINSLKDNIIAIREQRLAE